MFFMVSVLAILAGGKDLIVNFPQQPNWTGSISEMEQVFSVASATGWFVPYHTIFYVVLLFFLFCFSLFLLLRLLLLLFRASIFGWKNKYFLMASYHLKH